METIEDIVREMREGIVANSWYEQTMREFADRIEKAVSRVRMEDLTLIRALKVENASLRAELTEKAAFVTDDGRVVH